MKATLMQHGNVLNVLRQDVMVLRNDMTALGHAGDKSVETSIAAILAAVASDAPPA